MAETGRFLRGSGGSDLTAVLFDAGGTLIYMPRGPEQILQQLCGQLGISITPDQARGAFQQSEIYYAEHYLADAGDRGEFWLRYHGAALRHLGLEDPDGRKAAHLSWGFGSPGVWQAYPEASDVCRELRSKGLRLGVISNGPVTVADLLSQTGLLPYFDLVVTSQGVGIEKPDPRIFATALEGLGVDARQAVFVGDLYEVDVLGAQAVGLDAVLIDRQGSGGDLGCPVIHSLEELIPMLELSALSDQPSASPPLNADALTDD